MMKNATFVLADGSTVTTDVATNLDEAINLSGIDSVVAANIVKTIKSKMLPAFINYANKHGFLIKKNSQDSYCNMCDMKGVDLYGYNGNAAGRADVVCLSDLTLKDYNAFMNQEGDEQTRSHLLSDLGSCSAPDFADLPFVACTDMKKLYAINVDID